MYFDGTDGFITLGSAVDDFFIGESGGQIFEIDLTNDVFDFHGTTGGIRIYNSGDSDYGQFKHDGTDFYCDFSNTAWLRFTNITSGVIFDDGVAVYIRDSTGADSLAMSHDGTDFTFSVAGTTQVNFGVNNGLVITGNSYQTNPAGMAIGEYNTTESYLQAQSGGNVSVWTDSTARIANFADDRDTILYGDLVLNGASGNYALEGYDSQRCILRTCRIRITPGSTPGTNINVDAFNTDLSGFNFQTLTDGTNIAKSGSSGSFSLNASGNTVTGDLNNVIGIVSSDLIIHDINSSSTTDSYYVVAGTANSDITFGLILHGQQGLSDLTTIMDAGDIADVLITYASNT
jgi:hypothetical protein